MTKGRHHARIAALEALYEVDLTGHDPANVITRVIEGQHLGPRLADFSQGLAMGVLEHHEVIDGLIRQKAPLWPLEQIAAIDRAILRLAVYEMILDNEVPIAVAIDEAVELAKTFGSESSAKFVNGVLGAVAEMPKNKLREQLLSPTRKGR